MAEYIGEQSDDLAEVVEELEDRVGPTDFSNARGFVEAAVGRAAFFHRRGGWHFHDGSRYVRAAGEVTELAMQYLEDLHERAESEEDVARTKRCLTVGKVRSLLELAKSCGLGVRPENVDVAPWLLNTKSGLVDLKTGELVGRDQSLPITKVAGGSFDPFSEAPRWEQFLLEVFCDDTDLVDWFQRVVGYVLSGECSEEVFFLLHGTGANGKSTLMRVLEAVLGDYAVATPPSTFLSRGGNGPRNDLARLAGTCLVTAQEMPSGRWLAGSLMKQITGRDKIACRFLYQESFEFTPTFVPFLVANHRPRVDGNDPALWRRLRLIPFNARFSDDKETFSDAAEPDKGLDKKLLEELPGILNWAVRGCLEWQRRGLSAPPSVVQATRAYREDENLIGRFLTEGCEFSCGAEVTAKELREAYVEFCEELGERPARQNDVAAELQARGALQARGSGGVRLWRGVRLVGAEGEEGGSRDQ